MTKPEPGDVGASGDLSKIRPEHIQQAFENLTVRRHRTTRQLVAEGVRTTAVAASVALFGNVCAYGFENHLAQMQWVGGIGAALMVIWFWLGLYTER